MPWPDNSLDLNIIEKVSFYVVRTVYEKGKQYNSIKELDDNIYTAWDSINPDNLK